MHELYLHYVSCKGVWTRSSLVVNARKEHQHGQKSTFEFWTRERMIQELGSEALADDLIDRHKKAEKDLPPSKQGRFIIKTLIGLWNFIHDPTRLSQLVECLALPLFICITPIHAALQPAQEPGLPREGGSLPLQELCRPSADQGGETHVCSNSHDGSWCGGRVNAYSIAL